MSQTADFFRDIADRLERQEKLPYGPLPEPGVKQIAGECLKRMIGDSDKARTVWKLIVQDCGGYMPQAACVALIRATSDNVVPDVEAPEVG